MALMSKKIYMNNSSTNTQKTANIYDSTSDVGSNYMYVNVDGTAAYVPLVSTSDSRATFGRVTKDGTTYAIATNAIPVYTTKTITSGSGTFTVPAYVTKLRVTCIGGGCNGYGNHSYTNSTSRDDRDKSYSYATTRNSGGKTTFGSVTANGASSRTAGYKAGETKETTSSAGGTVTAAGGAAAPVTNYKGTQITTAGAGGSATTIGTWGDYNTAYAEGGASGYRTQSTITVTPGQKISYSVGAGGAASSFTQNSSYSKATANAGKAGIIYIEWGQGIQS